MFLGQLLASEFTELTFFFFFFLPHPAACRILVLWPGIELCPPAVEAQSPNRWTAREFPILQFKKLFYFISLFIPFNPHSLLVFILPRGNCSIIFDMFAIYPWICGVFIKFKLLVILIYRNGTVLYVLLSFLFFSLRTKLVHVTMCFSSSFLLIDAYIP